jgi:hypothetical protein
MSGDEMQQYLEAQGVATLEARTLAKEFSNDTEALQELIRTTEQAEAQEKAYYSAMATQA